jgi:hypothetical protein
MYKYGLLLLVLCGMLACDKSVDSIPPLAQRILGTWYAVKMQQTPAPVDTFTEQSTNIIGYSLI